MNQRFAQWTSTNAQGISNKIKDPFQQAVIEKKAILGQIRNHSRWPKLNISHLACGHAVFLPDIDDIQPLLMPESPCEVIGSSIDCKT